MSRTVRVAVTETVNAYPDMPSRLADLPSLAGRMDAVRDANLAHHEALAETAAGLGVGAIGFGELFTAPYFASVEDEMWFDLAEDAEDGPTIRRLREVAKRLAMVIVAPIYEYDASVDRRYNTAVVLDADGEIRGRYRKTHIPHGGNEQGTFFERFYYGAAEDDADPAFPVFETRVGRIGVSICYDRHFDGVMRSLAANGAELVFAPAVTFGAKSEYFWPREFAVDAMRHRIFIAGSNRAGTEPPFDQPYFGRSLVVGPDGPVDVHRDDPGLVWAEIDLDRLADPDGSGWRVVEDRRAGFYVP